MWRLVILVAGTALTLAVISVARETAQQTNALDAATKTLGADSIKTLRFTASGSNFTVGQNFTPDDPWPRVDIKSYSAAINYDTGSMRIELWREMGATMPRGG